MKQDVTKNENEKKDKWGVVQTDVLHYLQDMGEDEEYTLKQIAEETNNNYWCVRDAVYSLYNRNVLIRVRHGFYRLADDVDFEYLFSRLKNRRGVNEHIGGSNNE